MLLTTFFVLLCCTLGLASPTSSHKKAAGWKDLSHLKTNGTGAGNGTSGGNVTNPYPHPPLRFLKRQDAPTVISSIQTIASEIGVLNITLNSLEADQPMGIAKSIELQARILRVQTAMRTAIIYTRGAANMNEAHSHRASAAMIDLQPQVHSVCMNLINHKKVITSPITSRGGRAIAMGPEIQNFKLLAAQLGKIVQSKLSAPYDELAPLVTGKILAHLDAAIIMYSL